MRRGVGEEVGGLAVVDAGVDILRWVIGEMMGGKLSGRRWGAEERFRKRVIDPLRMLWCVLWKSGRSYVMHELRNWFRFLLIEATSPSQALCIFSKVPTYNLSCPVLSGRFDIQWHYPSDLARPIEQSMDGNHLSSLHR